MCNRRVSGALPTGAAQVIDLHERVLMPGLIDCHVPIVAVVASLGQNAPLPDLLVARSIRLQREMLMRGFTTVRRALYLAMACVMHDGMRHA